MVSKDFSSVAILKYGLHEERVGSFPTNPHHNLSSTRLINSVSVKPKACAKHLVLNKTYLLDRYICMAYTLIMIKSFGDSETEKIWNGKKSSKLPPEIHKRAFAKLLLINSAENEDDLKVPPGNKFERLQGNLKEYCSIRINIQWRIIFKFQNNEAYEVQIVDYH